MVHDGVDEIERGLDELLALEANWNEVGALCDPLLRTHSQDACVCFRPFLPLTLHGFRHHAAPLDEFVVSLL